MKLEKITPRDIEKMNYNELIGLVKETNRPPGGIGSIYHILDRLFIDKETKILEIGTSTGFTALEISRLTGSDIKSIDINDISLQEARKRAEEEKLKNIEFIKADAKNLPFKDNSFDLVFCGNLFSIIDEKDKSFKEVKRVTKRNGFVAIIPMYYLEKPSKELLKNISRIIGTNIIETDKKYWLKFLENPFFEIYFIKDFKFDKIGEEKVKDFVKNILSREHLKQLTEEAMNSLKIKYEGYMLSFRENLSHMGYSIIILRKTDESVDPELFTSKSLK